MFTPSLKHKLRVSLGKDQRRVRPELYNLMHQVEGAKWAQILQNTSIDGYITKFFSRFFGVILIVFFFIYIFSGGL